MEQPQGNDLMVTIHGLELDSVTQVEIHRARYSVSVRQEVDGTLQITAKPIPPKPVIGRKRSATRRKHYSYQPHFKSVFPVYRSPFKLSIPVPLPPFCWLKISCLNLSEITKEES